MKADLAKGGFNDVESETLDIEQPVSDWAHFAHGLVFGNPLIDEINNRGGVDADDVAGALEASLRKRFGPEPSSMPLKATVFQGRAG